MSFKKIHHRRYVPGLERVILKKLPLYLAGGTLVPVFMAILARFGPFAGFTEDPAKMVLSVDILAIALVITVWTAIFTVAIGCIIVRVMKGPTYVADSYELQDSERPRRDDHET